MCDNIMYIDDNAFEHYIVESLFKTYSTCNKITCFFKGRDALSFLVQNKDNILETPDVIFLDLSMPDFTGWDFLEEFDKIKLIFCKMPKVYILSSSVDQGEINRSSNYTFVKSFISKPLTPTIIGELD